MVQFQYVEMEERIITIIYRMMDLDSDSQSFLNLLFSLSHISRHKNLSVPVQRRGLGFKRRQSLPQDSRNNRWPLPWRPIPPHIRLSSTDPQFLTLHIPPSACVHDPPRFPPFLATKKSCRVLIIPCNRSGIFLLDVPLMCPPHPTPLFAPLSEGNTQFMSFFYKLFPHTSPTPTTSTQGLSKLELTIFCKNSSSSPLQSLSRASFELSGHLKPPLNSHFHLLQQLSSPSSLL